MRLELGPRDRKLLLVVVPAALAATFWFLLLSPLRAEAERVTAAVERQGQARDAAVARAAELERAGAGHAADLETVVRLGKAVPPTLDMPSLIVQLEAAARGTGIAFAAITPGDPQTSTDAPRTAPGAAASTPTLEAVPLELALSGTFFDLADFLHRQKRFVRVERERVLVHGRLMTVDSFHVSAAEGARRLAVEMTATVYLSPKTDLPAPAAAPGAAGASSAAASGGTPPIALVAR